MKRLLPVLSFLLMVAGTAPVSAQFQQDPFDPGAADTMDFVFSVVPDFTTHKLKLQADLYVFNDAAYIVGVSSGFTWDNPNLQMDSAVATPLAITSFDFGRYFYEGYDINVTNTNQRFLFGALTGGGAGLAPHPTRQHLASYYFTLSSWDACDSVIIDTLGFNAGSELLFAAADNTAYLPYVMHPDRYKDTACAAPSNLLISPDSLHFSAVEGSSSPAAQQFTINSDNEPLAFQLTETTSWFSATPILGTTMKSITVLPNIIGLTAGTYIDSIRVSSADAANSPQWVKITMTIEEPPSEIGVSPSALFFNAVAGGANPDPKTLSIFNEGGQTLSWSLANDQGWLQVSPSSGTGDADVAVSVDITGLAYDTYYDTIVVTDPLATNSPVRVPVTLSVGSDLPVIAVDSAFNYIVVPAGMRDVEPWTLVVRNEGAGTMNFWLEESTSRILALTPSSGTAPQPVTVDFKLTLGTVGNDYYDTVWVYSNEAINSPFPVVFLFHIVDDPCNMVVTVDTVKLNLYECEMGARGLNPSQSFFVQNVGGDDPMSFVLTWESQLFTVTTLGLVAPSAITVKSNYLGLPLGTYYDTIVVYAYKALPSTDTVIVQYTVMAATQQPKIWVSGYNFTVPVQENRGPLPDVAFAIRNEYGGCMPWYIVENVPWLYPNDTSGINPASVPLGLNADGVPFGQYPDSFKVYAPTASNSPGKVRFNLKVWRFHGDNNYNGVVAVNDLTYLVNYLFKQGPEPQPDRIVGDMNCTWQIDASDLTYFVNYLFRQGPIPCGNPYK